jgi:hypothetical protein
VRGWRWLVGAAIVVPLLGVVGVPSRGTLASTTVSELVRLDLGDVVQGATAVPTSDGRVLVSAVVDRKPTIVKVLGSGGLDETFAATAAVPGVRVREDAAESFTFGEQTLSLFVQPNDRFVTTGAWGLTRFTVDGFPDPGFAIPGGPIVPEGTVPVQARSAVQLDDGRILAVQGGYGELSTQVLLADGVPDASYAPLGRIDWPFVDPGDAPSWKSQLQRRGASWTMAVTTASQATAIVTFDADGRLASGDDGFRRYPDLELGFPVPAVDGTGRTLVSGHELGTGRCLVARLLADGSRDLTFGAADDGHLAVVPGSCSRPIPIVGGPGSSAFVAIESASGIVVHQLGARGIIGRQLVPATVGSRTLQLWMDGSDPMVMSTRDGELTISRLGAPLPPSALESVVPARLMETRSGPDAQTVDGLARQLGRRPAGSTYELRVAGRGAVPLDAAAAMLNVTAVLPSTAGFVTVYPCGRPRPLASNLNFGPGDVVPNAVLVKLGTSGKVCLYTSATSDLVVDVNGYVPAG